MGLQAVLGGCGSKKKYTDFPFFFLFSFSPVMLIQIVHFTITTQSSVYVAKRPVLSRLKKGNLDSEPMDSP